MRHLTPEQAATHLRLGKTLEQWLGTRKEVDYDVMRWIRVRQETERGYVVTLFEGIEDERAAENLYWAYAVESDEDGAAQPVDAAGKEFTFEDENKAVEFVRSELGGSPDRFVNEGLLQGDYRASKGT